MENMNKNANNPNNEDMNSESTKDLGSGREENEKDLDHKVMGQWRRLEDLLNRMRATQFQNYGPGGDPARGQGRVLALLKMQPEISQKELCYLLGMRQQSLSELLAKLEQKGYVSRRPSEEDKRVTIISLTEEGAAAARQQPRRRGGMHRILTALEEDEKNAFLHSVDKLIAAAEQELTELGVDPYGPASHRHGKGHHHGRPGAHPFEHRGKHHPYWDEETIGRMRRGRYGNGKCLD